MTKALHWIRLPSMPMAAQRRIAGRPQRKTEGREGYHPQRADRERGNSERQPIETRRAGRPAFRPDAENAVVTAGEAHPLERDGPDDLRKGERQHRKIDAG